MHGDAVLVEPEEDGLRLDPVDPEADEMREPIDGIAEDRQPVDGLGRFGEQPIGQARAASAGRPSNRSPASSPTAAAKPTAAATFSSPARRLRSWAPPRWNGGIRRPRRTRRAPMPLGPPNLWAVTEQRSAPRAAKSMGRCPAAAQASTWVRHAPLPNGGHHGRRGLDGPHLVVGQLHGHQRRLRPDPGQHRGRVEPAQPVDAGHGHPTGPVGGLEDGGVLDGEVDDVDSAGPVVSQRRSRASAVRNAIAAGGGAEDRRR